MRGLVPDVSAGFATCRHVKVAETEGTCRHVEKPSAGL